MIRIKNDLVEMITGRLSTKNNNHVNRLFKLAQEKKVWLSELTVPL